MGLYYKAIYEEVETRTCFFLYRNGSLLLTLLITFKTIGSPEKFSSNKQPRYVTVWYCLICISSYLISRLLTLLSLCFMPNSIPFYCLLRNEWSVYYLQTNPKHLKNSCLGFFLFLSRLYADKLNRSYLHIEINHIYSLLLKFYI